MNKTTAIEQNLKDLNLAQDVFNKSHLNHVKLNDTDTVLGSLNYIESLFNNILKMSVIDDSDNFNLEYEFYRAMSKVKLLLGVPTDFSES